MFAFLRESPDLVQQHCKTFVIKMHCSREGATFVIALVVISGARFADNMLQKLSADVVIANLLSDSHKESAYASNDLQLLQTV